MKVTKDLLNAEQSDLLVFNDVMSATESVHDYSSLKQWLYSQYDVKAAITRTQKAIFAWNRVEGERLVTS